LKHLQIDCEHCCIDPLNPASKAVVCYRPLPAPAPRPCKGLPPVGSVLVDDKDDGAPPG